MIKDYGNADVYQMKCLETASNVSMATKYNLLLQGVMGLCGESGEVIDIVKKHIFQGHKFDESTKNHIAKELGDIAWYLATTAHSIDYPLSTIFEMNVEKLSNRYSEGHFEVDKSVNRKEGDV